MTKSFLKYGCGELNENDQVKCGEINEVNCGELTEVRCGEINKVC